MFDEGSRVLNYSTLLGVTQNVILLLQNVLGVRREYNLGNRYSRGLFRSLDYGLLSHKLSWFMFAYHYQHISFKYMIIMIVR